MNTEQLKQSIRTIPDFPKKGIMFRDITTLLKDPEAFSSMITLIAEQLKDKNIDIVIGPEARGFIVGAAVAHAIGAGFVPARKQGKLPCEVNKVSYGLEYGTDCLEVHKDAIKPGQRVAVVDDLLATGGTALAVIQLVEQLGAVPAAAAFAVELTELPGRETLKNYDVISLIKY